MAKSLAVVEHLDDSVIHETLSFYVIIDHHGVENSSILMETIRSVSHGIEEMVDHSKFVELAVTANCSVADKCLCFDSDALHQVRNLAERVAALVECYHHYVPYFVE